MAAVRSPVRYKVKPDQDAPLAAKLVQFKDKHPRFGIRRAHALRRADGQTINHKRMERVWRKSGFQVLQCPKKRIPGMSHRVPCQAERPS